MTSWTFSKAFFNYTRGDMSSYLQESDKRFVSVLCLLGFNALQLSYSVSNC